MSPLSVHRATLFWLVEWKITPLMDSTHGHFLNPSRFDRLTHSQWEWLFHVNISNVSSFTESLSTLSLSRWKPNNTFWIFAPCKRTSHIVSWIIKRHCSNSAGMNHILTLISNLEDENSPKKIPFPLKMTNNRCTYLFQAHIVLHWNSETFSYIKCNEVHSLWENSLNHKPNGKMF